MQNQGRQSAERLGYAGLIPFITLVAGGVFGSFDAAWLQFALLAYAAAILSFLGGIVWGRAATFDTPSTAKPFFIAVLPSLAGWATLLIGGALGLMLCALGFAILLLHDLNDDLPLWFATLRRNLSIGAIACCIIGSVVL